MIDLINLLPYSRNKHYVLFLNNGIDALSVHVSERTPELKDAFRDEDYIFLPLAEIEASMTPEMVQYMFPWRGLTVYKGGVEDTFRQVYNVGDKAGLLCINGKETEFYPIEDGTEWSFNDVAEELLLKLNIEAAPAPEAPSPMSKPLREAHGIVFKCTRSKCSAGRELSRELPAPARAVEEEPLEPGAQAIVDAWQEFSKRYGISIEELARLVNEKVRLSRLVITHAGTILLADYGNREVKMDNLTKALYFFYLLHPEGVRQKALYDYKDEILKLYLQFNRRDDLDELRLSVDRLLLDDNRVNVSLSRIKAAFKEVVGDWVAKYYYIDGKAGEARSIKLDRDFVIWEP